MIQLRPLLEKDIPFMLEWMHDESVTRFFRFESLNFTEEDVRAFIASARVSKDDAHFAIADDDDEYLGTISLKKIDRKNRNAEYAVCVRKGCMGRNIAKAATDLVLSYAFRDMGLHKVHLNVLTENVRAIRFYEKYGFVYEGTLAGQILHRGLYKDLRLYAAFNPEN